MYGADNVELEQRYRLLSEDDELVFKKDVPVKRDFIVR